MKRIHERNFFRPVAIRNNYFFTKPSFAECVLLQEFRLGKNEEPHADRDGEDKKHTFRLHAASSHVGAAGA